MSTSKQNPDVTKDSARGDAELNLPFEERKWADESRFREREIALQERVNARSKWSAPIVLAVSAAAVAGFSNAGVAWLNSRAQIALEDRKSEQARILEMISAATPEAVRSNLEFLLRAGLVDDAAQRSELEEYLSETPDDALPVSNETFYLSMLSKTQEAASALAKLYADQKQAGEPDIVQVIGYDNGMGRLVFSLKDGEEFSVTMNMAPLYFRGISQSSLEELRNRIAEAAPARPNPTK
jgi:hypothetical protein